MTQLILASASRTRADLLRAAGLEFEVRPARIDEVALRESLQAEETSPREIADMLAESKALQVGGRHPDALVLGCDQIMEVDGDCLGKPGDRKALRDRLLYLRGRTHRLHSAAVLYSGARPVWRHVSEASLTMRDFSEAFLDSFLATVEDNVLQTVGGYAIESLGLRLFDRIDGDYFGILGLPLVELLSVLARRGDIAG